MIRLGRSTVAAGGGCTHVMHRRNRMIIDPRIPTMPGGGARRVFTDHADIVCTKREAPRGVGRVA